MRLLLATAALCLLAACGEPDNAPPATQPDAVPSEAATAAPVVLSGTGIARAGETVAFGSPRDLADRLAAQAGAAGPETSTNGECGAGPMEFSRHGGGLTLNYQDGKLVGWTLDEPSDVTLAGGLAVGAPRVRAEAIPGFAMVEDSTLGEEFYSEAEGLGGFFEQGKVDSLYAGTTCFFR